MKEEHAAEKIFEGPSGGPDGIHQIIEYWNSSSVSIPFHQRTLLTYLCMRDAATRPVDRNVENNIVYGCFQVLLCVDGNMRSRRLSHSIIAAGRAVLCSRLVTIGFVTGTTCKMPFTGLDFMSHCCTYL